MGEARSVPCGRPDRSRACRAEKARGRRAHHPDPGPARAPRTQALKAEPLFWAIGASGRTCGRGRAAARSEARTAA